MIRRVIDFIENRELRPLDEEFFRTLVPTVMEIVRKPSSNPPAAAVLALIAVTLVTLVLLAVIQLILRNTDVDEDDYVYVLVDEEGNEISAAPAAVLAREPSSPRAKGDSLRYHWAALGVIGSLVVLLAAAGAGSQSREACLSCHDGVPHTAAAADDAHRSVRCIDCHESGGALSSLSLAVPARMAHIISGYFLEQDNGRFGPVPGRACLACHEGIIQGVVENPDRALRISHREPHEAGAGCRHCHALDDEGKLGRLAAGMSTCLRCHNEEDASAACSTCHTGDVGLAARSTVKHAPRQIVTRPNCYSCHQSAACDACHGVRLPHSPDYRRTHMMDAARDIWLNQGRVCFTCHTAVRNSCYQRGCHANELDFHRGEDPTFPETHGSDPEWTCDSCHMYAADLDDPCAMCHERVEAR